MRRLRLCGFENSRKVKLQVAVYTWTVNGGQGESQLLGVGTGGWRAIPEHGAGGSRWLGAMLEGVSSHSVAWPYGHGDIFRLCIDFRVLSVQTRLKLLELHEKMDRIKREGSLE